MAQSEIASHQPRSIGLRHLAADLRLRLALALLGTGGSARLKLTELLQKNGFYKGPILRLKDRTLVACGDHHMWVRNQDDGVGRGLLKHGAWQRDDFETALRLIMEQRGRNGGVFVDIGANIGTHCVYAALSGRFERVIAIEPEPRNAAIIRDNISLNDLSIGVDIVQKAVGDGTRTVCLNLHASDSGMHSVVKGPGAHTIEVELDTLPNILGGLGVEAEDVGFIWMDVEGHEFEVFKPLESLFLRRTPIFFEYSRWAIGDQRPYWAAKFNSFGYDCYLMKHGGRAHKTGFADALAVEFGNLLLL
jgi:FkbM family methyltransferase